MIDLGVEIVEVMQRDRFTRQWNFGTAKLELAMMAQDQVLQMPTELRRKRVAFRLLARYAKFFSRCAPLKSQNLSPARPQP